MLMSVANPWMDGSPAPPTSQDVGGSPGCAFSHAIGLVTGGPQGPPASAALKPDDGAATRATLSSRTSAISKADDIRPRHLPLASPLLRTSLLDLLGEGWGVMSQALSNGLSKGSRMRRRSRSQTPPDLASGSL